MKRSDISPRGSTMIWNVQNISAVFSIVFLYIYSFYVGAFSFCPEILTASFMKGSLFNGALLMGVIIPVIGIVLTGSYVVLADRMDCEDHSR
ncbi:DUF485 domain-containing protein [Gluconacetobacter sacchari]|uniref:DUF485 domain-containing protein n=1 Tax=Gluconacetobacter sacchari TaxID=92759 RepID=A0A7W4NPS9_9PROT|nr:DUF485 domain-containing protein [Gluconacetobacter sacchari]MBB2161802.1 DUF485 domain-containing protein [Gluconacetobacter sacchari]